MPPPVCGLFSLHPPRSTRLKSCRSLGFFEIGHALYLRANQPERIDLSQARQGSGKLFRDAHTRPVLARGLAVSPGLMPFVGRRTTDTALSLWNSIYGMRFTKTP